MENGNKRKTDVNSLIQTFGPIVAVSAAGFAWYITDSSQKVSAQEIEKHDDSEAAHYQKHNEVRERLSKHDLDVAEIKGSISRIEAAVQANKDGVQDIREDQRETLRILRDKFGE